MILCFQLCSNSLGRALSCFSMTMPHAQSEVHTEMVCRDRCGRTWLAWVLTSTPLNSSCGWMEASPWSNFPTSSGKHSQKSEAVIATKRGPWLMIKKRGPWLKPMIVEWDVWRAGVHIHCGVSVTVVNSIIIRPLNLLPLQLEVAVRGWTLPYDTHPNVMIH